MSDSPVLTVSLILVVALVAAIALALYPPPPEPEEGRVLALLQIEDAEPGFSNTTTFQVEEEYTRIGLTYIIEEAAHVRASVTSPGNTTHEADAIVVEGDDDRLELDVLTPEQGTWAFTIWTLDEETRQGSITYGEFYILGFGGQRPPDGAQPGLSQSV